MERVLLKEFKNGNKQWGTKVKCAKCGGSGQVIWTYADHVCFDCDGKGWYWYKETEYTPENLAKLEAKKAKKQAEREAERAKREAEHEARIAQWKREQAEWEAKRRGHFYGEIGQKIEIEVTYTGCSSFDTYYGTTWVYKFDTDDGAHLVWKTGTNLGGNEWLVINGDRIKIKATIKDHKEYNGIEQTELKLVKVLKGVSKFYTLSREELEESNKLQRDYGWESEEHLSWLREHQLAHANG